ncbi:MAG TPA: bifunctional precorrin-2 dehydrogenase/sirohydrochlorin ferrochelatase [Candidatus Binatia bacterium]|nr:bifunctional precorrin-2 dehydrogenase/sirohydrochlorin ferrochelatase [Candidatus Binatia bacterium]
MGYYPVFFEMKQRRCVVIGGGRVAERRVEGLLAVGASVTVISPAITEGLRRLLTQGSIRHVAREHRPGDLSGCELAFIAMDDSELNAAACREARSRYVWVNSADDPAQCDFIVPSVLRRGELVVAVSTGGESPAVTRAIREELDEYIGAHYAQLVQTAGEVRKELRGKSIRPTAEAWSSALKGEFRRLIKEGRPEQAKTLLLETLGVKS